MKFVLSKPNFNSLSLLDLLKARDQFHLHLMQKANVIGTAVGLYLIRSSDPYPKQDSKPAPVKKAAAKTSPKPPRTLENAEVRDYSWPCVLVFVSRWESEDQFGGRGQFSAFDMVPKTIYLDDGRSVPVCVVWAPTDLGVPAALNPDKANASGIQLECGCAALAEVQGAEHIATVGCLVSDGHKVYALTNRHVAGRSGENLYTYLNGQRLAIGTASEKQLGRVAFEELYDKWPGKNVYVNIDAGLVELENESLWSPSVKGLGDLGPLADVGPHNLSLNIIGCELQAHGAVTGRLEGRVAALFYRYKAIGGFEYVAEFLIGGRKGNPLKTRPSDSGAIWVTESDDAETNNMPLAVQWGGAVFNAEKQKLPFALASNLSNICRILECDLFRSRELAGFEYWGPVGHYTIGWFACDQVTNTKLRKLMRANQHLIGINYDPQGPSTPSGFTPLADVPDVVWKGFYNATNNPAGRKGPENPNHYADIDYPPGAAETLDTLTPDAASLKPDTWRTFYDSIGWTKVAERGLLPFRIWQIYKQMVAFVKARKLDEFVTAAGILAHYVGDGCQALHGSYLTDGDPFRNPDGSPSATMLGHGDGYAGGLHTSYESTMINGRKSQLWLGLHEQMPASSRHQMTLVTGGQEAGFAAIELMRRTQAKIPPKDLVKTYGERVSGGTATLWNAFGNQTIECIADGCRTLAMIWDSAWAEGNGDTIASSKLTVRDPDDLKELYSGDSRAANAFLFSAPLNGIDTHL